MSFHDRLDARHNMTRPGFSRRAFLRSSGIVIGGGLGLGLPGRFRGPSHGWLSTVAAQSLLFDPVPDPIAAGWTKEGNEPHFPVGTSLRITDTTNTGFVRFFVDALPAFADDVELNPSVMVGSGFTVDAEQYIGVHVAINDGDRQVKAALLGMGGGLRVALGLASGYSRGFVLPTTQATFKVKRLTDGRGYLEVPGQPPEIVFRTHLMASQRPGFQTLEFGSDGTGEVSTSEWFTLGLPPLVPTVAFASFHARADIRPGATNNLDMEALFTLGAASDGIDPLSEPVTFTLGPREWRIGPGLFRQHQRGGWFSFQGVVDGTRLGVAITPLRQRGRYGFAAVGAGAEFGDMANPVPVSLRIGDDAGRTEVIAKINAQ